MEAQNLSDRGDVADARTKETSTLLTIPDLCCAAEFSVAIVLLPPLLMGGDWFTWVYRALLLLAIACLTARAVLSRRSRLDAAGR